MARKDINKDLPITKKTNLDFVKDKFGDSPKVTICNSIMTFIYLAILIAPFIIIGLAIFYFKDGIIIHYMHFLILFFGCWCIFFIFYVPILTLMNNHRTNHTYHKNITHNQERLQQKITWLHGYYSHKFGKHLHSRKVFTVDKNNNIPVDYIIKSYQRKDNDL